MILFMNIPDMKYTKIIYLKDILHSPYISKTITVRFRRWAKIDAMAISLKAGFFAVALFNQFRSRKEAVVYI